MAELHVGLVAADREVWTGDASMVIARTVEGDIGILPGHEPLLAVLADGPVRIRPVDGSEIVAAVHGGFLSVSESGVSVLAEMAELASEIDVTRARRSIDEARAASADDAEADAARRRAETRLRVAEGG